MMGIKKGIDLGFVYPLVKDLYSPFGAESINPVVLIKLNIIQYTFGIRSMRQTIKEIEVNTAYRWYIGYGLTERIPHFSTFSKNYTRNQFVVYPHNSLSSYQKFSFISLLCLIHQACCQLNTAYRARNSRLLLSGLA